MGYYFISLWHIKLLFVTKYHIGYKKTKSYNYSFFCNLTILPYHTETSQLIFVLDQTREHIYFTFL